ncbi:hypothetical protein HUK80_17745 [Flavobacterium sp. MAH-1]|uniref:Uncharacterized protein n=1 Tax=Flavobacterium agri TaxID=2743471 RepID=A0A7Y8Y545_9FLAO|nr:hypothetical protein [Flavobacterium agri]NUY82751.1 hypothetical protein [Flavobacterium agri]NYA72774.1 hypothetical protein [Flavobacterium agri]
MENYDIQKVDNAICGVFQFVDASSSASRATLPIITTKENLSELMRTLPKLRGKKKEYSDYWVLGIMGFDSKNLTDFDKKNIEVFYSKIQKYRADNNLSAYSAEQLSNLTLITSEKSEICKRVNCTSSGNRR